MSDNLPDSKAEPPSTTVSLEEQAKGVRIMRIIVFVFIALVALLVGVQMLRS